MNSGNEAKPAEEDRIHGSSEVNVTLNPEEATGGGIQREEKSKENNQVPASSSPRATERRQSAGSANQEEEFSILAICGCLLSASVSFGLAVFSIADCSFVRDSDTSNRRLVYDYSDGRLPKGRIESFGLFGYSEVSPAYFLESNDEGCKTFPEEVKENLYFDRDMRTARAFGVLAAIATGLAVIYSALRLKLNFDSRRVYLLFLCGVALVSQALTFRISRSALNPRNYDYTTEYELGPAGKGAAVNVGVLAIAFLLIASTICDASLLASSTFFALSVFSIAHCSFASDWLLPGGMGLFGLWAGYPFGCVAYPTMLKEEDEFDFAIKTARAVGVIAAVTSGLAVVYCALKLKFDFDSRRYILLILYGVALISQSLTFMFFQSDMYLDDFGFKLGPAGVGAAVNSALLLVAFLLVVASIWKEESL